MFQKELINIVVAKGIQMFHDSSDIFGHWTVLLPLWHKLSMNFFKEKDLEANFHKNGDFFLNLKNGLNSLHHLFSLP